jgi:hypothetical protein
MTRPRRIRLIHWNANEARARVARLRTAGYQVTGGPLDADGLRGLKASPPDAVVIDLTRLPGQGRDVALALRKARATRRLPLVFVEGDRDKVDGIRRQLPDAVYASWRGIRGALKRAIAAPPADPAVPESGLAGYSGTPLPKKLGIKRDAVVVLLGAPPDFLKTLGPLPDGVTIRRQARGRADLILWFTRSRADLDRRIARLGGLLGPGDGLWIIWPKKASGVTTDVTQTVVRETGLASGLVDYKICAVDATWSGLKFARRKR